MPLDFIKLISSRFVLVFAAQMQAVILGWQMYILTGSAYSLGLIGLVEAVPALGLALFAGYIADHRKPLPIYIGVILTCGFSALLLFLTQSDLLHLSVNTRVIALYVSSFLTGVARAFTQPSIYAIVPVIVPRENLSRAAAITASTMQSARVMGPAAGGVLFAVYGVSTTAFLISVLLIGAAVPAFFIKKSPEPGQKIKSEQRFIEDLLSGLKYVFKHPILFPALTLDMVSVFLGGVTALLPIFASDILKVGPEGLGILRAAPAIGAAIVSGILTFITIDRHAGRYIFFAVTGFGLSIVLFSLSTSFVLSVLALGLSGAFDSISVVIRSAAVQLCSPEEMRGRISSVNSIFVGSSNELGQFESGILAGLLGTVPAALLGGVACIVTVGVMLKTSPRLRQLNLATLTPEELIPSNPTKSAM